MTASRRIAAHAVRTPLLRCDTLDRLSAARIFLKCETLQRTGSFKFRGAFNRLAALDASQRAAGVVAFSSGNHAQGIAAAASILGLRSTIVMPSDAPLNKVNATRSHGADLVFYDRWRESRETIAAELAHARGAVLVPSFDDPLVVAGQGTAGLEARADLAALGLVADTAVICCGGGGLASGIALAIPETAIVTVEPEGYDDVARSLASGTIQAVTDPQPTLCDALQTPAMAPLTFGILHGRGARGVTVSEDEVRAAMRFAFAELKLVIEPGGAAALAAVLAAKVDVAGQVVLVTLSGGNVDPELFSACLATDQAAATAAAGTATAAPKSGAG